MKWHLTNTPAQDIKDGYHLVTDQHGNYWKIMLPPLPNYNMRFQPNDSEILLKQMLNA